NALYSEGSIDSFPKRDNLPSYTASPKMDYSSRYELKIDGEEDDPDIIPVQFDKKPLDDFSKPQIGMEGDTIKIYREQSVILPNSGVSIP
ncbi:jg21456, partial [Pararge aegeria aegeria]